MKKAFKIILLVLVLLALVFCLTQGVVNAQLCNGTLGQPVVNVDFGRGASQGGPAIECDSHKGELSPEDSGNWRNKGVRS